MAGYSVTFSVVDNASKQIDAINRRMQAMRAPMERLSKSVSRFLDVSGLRKIGEGFSFIARSAGTAFRSISAIVPAMGAITGAASIAGMARLVSSFGSFERQLRVTADMTGQTVDQVQRMEDAYKLAGGSASEMDEVLKGLTESAKEASISAGDQQRVYRQLGIAWQDANGKIKTASELLPEVLDALNKIPNPAQRAAMAITLFGPAGARFVETMRTANRTWAEYLDLASRMPQATQEQRDALNRWLDAQNALSVSFTHLGEQIAGTIAQHFTPLLEHLNAFVNQNTPQIIGAIDQVAGKFADWLSGINWGDVQTGLTNLTNALTEVGKGLQFIIDHSNTIIDIFLIGWGVKMVASIAQVTTAIGAAAGAVAGGTGLLGALGAVAAIAAALSAGAAVVINKNKNEQIETEAGKMGYKKKSGTGTWYNPIPTWVDDKGHELSQREMMLLQGADPERGFGAFQTPRAPPNMVTNPNFQPSPAPPSAPPPQAPWDRWKGGAGANLPQGDNIQRGAAVRDQLANDLGISKAAASGIVGNLWSESGLQAINEKNPIVAGSRGGFGWAQWTGPRRDEFESWAAKNHLDPRSDEANYGFLRYEIAQDPKLMAALKGAKTPTEAAAIVERMYERPAQYQERGPAAERFAAAPGTQVAQGPPLATPAAASPGGRLDIGIKGSNLPPGTTIDANAQGPGLNVAPPRVEQPQLASI